MREIVFRGKSKGKLEWVYGSLYKEGSQVFILVGGRFYPELSNGQSALGIMDWYEVFPDSIGQFTGLTDKNDRNIFEGDIVKSITHFYSELKEMVTVVKFNEVENDSFGEPFTVGYSLLGSEWEIIGNIHDNPELLS
jgi:uncharacterized phage protein (TIGR01671 family)